MIYSHKILGLLSKCSKSMDRKINQNQTEAKQKNYLPREIKALDLGIKQKTNICHLDSFG